MGKREVCTIIGIADDDPLGRKVGDKIVVEWPDFGPGCGYACSVRNWETGTCDEHGPTEIDRIAEASTKGFRGDLSRIMGEAASLRARDGGDR